jgi:2-beta-glucuronyltransferase
MNKAILITGHYWDSKRRAGFHWIADALVRLGWDVLFVTTSLSRLSVLRRDYRLSYPVRSEAGVLVRKQANVSSYVWYTPWHPANMRLALLNRVTSPLFSTYGQLSLGSMEGPVSESDLFIFESTAGLMLYDRFRALNSRARFVYRVSDDLRFLRCHPVVTDYEAHFAREFDLISVPSAALAKQFQGLPQVRLLHHGIDKQLFDADWRNPYDSGRTRAILVGTSHVDYDFLERASRMRPDWDFHLIGPLRAPSLRPNIHVHGEMPFTETVPYVKHAHIGLQSLLFSPGAESLSDSLKVIQYTYCRLPIVAPDFMVSSRRHMVRYDPGSDASIDQALSAAAQFDRLDVDISDIGTWDDVARALVA